MTSAGIQSLYSSKIASIVPPKKTFKLTVFLLEEDHETMDTFFIENLKVRKFKKVPLKLKFLGGETQTSSTLPTSLLLKRSRLATFFYSSRRTFRKKFCVSQTPDRRKVKKKLIFVAEFDLVFKIHIPWFFTTIRHFLKDQKDQLCLFFFVIQPHIFLIF